MPAKRLPWFKLWPEAVEHEKIAQLSDGVFRTWITALAKAADQPTRWHFASRRHAAAVAGRPVSHITTLVNCRLLDDQGADGLWIHDWKQWQERYPSDVDSPPSTLPPTLPPTLPEHSANTPANGAANAPPSPDDASANAPTRVKSIDVRPEELTNRLARPGKAGYPAAPAREASLDPALQAEHERLLAKDRASRAKPSQPSQIHSTRTD